MSTTQKVILRVLVINLYLFLCAFFNYFKLNIIDL